MQVVAHNLPAQFTNRQLNITTADKAKSAEKLSSGYRINRAADDAAGLGISETMRWQIRGLDKGSSNTQDGMSLLQVADGALAQVHSMLDRVKELSVQAANDTNTLQDRQAIQKEINQIILEIDRIGDDTEFNTIKVFQGGYSRRYGPDGNPIYGPIPIECLHLQLTNPPFTENTPADRLFLSVVPEGVTSEGVAVSDRWELLYPSGTSPFSVRVTYPDPNVSGQFKTVDHEITLNDLDRGSYSSQNGVSERKFKHDFGDGVAVCITQRIEVGQHTGHSQDYKFTYTIENTGSTSADIKFLFTADTAYKPNGISNEDADRREAYYIEGQRVDNFCMYTQNSDYLAQGTNNNLDSIKNLTSYPGTRSLSVVGLKERGGTTLSDESFSQKWSWAEDPETLVIGRYGRFDSWDKFQDVSNTGGPRGNMLGYPTRNDDIALSMIWNCGTGKEINFSYGIVERESDSNVQGAPVDYDMSGIIHSDHMDLWIQSGALQWSGQFITIGEMNSRILGISDLDVTSHENASQSIAATDWAIDHISAQRSLIGAQTNRLEHTKMIDDNTSENTQAAESRLRDTDMAEEMVDYSKHSILEQAGEAMLAQANQMPQGILNLLF